MLPKDLVDKYYVWKGDTFSKNKDSFEKLAKEGQSPQYMFISCVDSRVDPNSIFNSNAGELFVHRNIANLVPRYDNLTEHSGTIAAIEFGICALNIKNIIVMGHSGCGGIKNGFHMCKDNESETNSSAVPKWLQILKPAYETLSKEDEEKMIDKLEKVSIVSSLENLKQYPFIKKGLDANEINLFGIWNDIGTGTISVYNHKTKNFEPI
tara:strand:+ start:132 stop:758 length:627 start_codon:yes stop_codon:yes gene_type:complete